MNATQKVVAYLQGLLGPINKLPSWANEGLAGVVAIPALYTWLGLYALVLFETVSTIYEWWRWPKIDPNGFSAEDVGQRTVGAVLTQLALLGIVYVVGVHHLWVPFLGLPVLAAAWWYSRRLP